MAVLEIMVVAGEVSGDQHAAELVAQLRNRLPEARFFGMGGTKLAQQGADLLYGAHEVSVMGIAEVLPKLPRIWKVIKGLERAAARRRPACAILVDIPDFNLRLARRLKRFGIPVVYYVSPMVWAWRRGRIEAIAGRVDEMLCILPFEESIYRRAGVRARYVGNPLLEQLPPPAEPRRFRQALGLDPSRPTLALLPGSRILEVRRILPAMAGAARELSAERPELQVVIPIADAIPRIEISSHFEATGIQPALVEGRAAEVIGASEVAVVASGTAVLEAGLMQRPAVVVYRVAPLTYLIGRLLLPLNIEYIGLVNLLLGRRVFPELIQHQMTAKRIAAEVRRLWQGPAREEVLRGLSKLRPQLGSPGAAGRAAQEVLTLIRGLS
jgi:lipid-A-disaccharide synthase